MGTECDIKKRVSNLESIGRKICSDLRNFQKERTILSQEAKCLLRKMEKEQARKRRYRNKRKHANNTGCACTIWEKDLIKNSESDLEESSKFQKDDDQLLICENCCRCGGSLNEEKYPEDLFETSKCSICGVNELGEPFHCSHCVKTCNLDENDDDNSCFLDINNTTDLMHEACTIDFSEFCDVCVFCKENRTKNLHDLSFNDTSYIDNESDPQESIERQRGGGGETDSESMDDETTNSTSVCICECSICALRNTQGDKPPCCLGQNRPNDDPIEVDSDENLQLNCSTVSNVSEIHQYCKITKLREALEKLKNRNHTLRKLLKQKRDCLVTNSMMEQSNDKFSSSSCNNYDDNNNGNDNKNIQDELKETPRELVAVLKILQSKCRTKDGMIVALADELKECATDERIQRIIDKLNDAKIHCNVIDFDRSTLWKYLVPKQLNQIEQHSYRRKNIVDKKPQCCDIMIGIFILSFIFLANIHYRYRFVIMFVFHNMCDAFYRVYDILHNLQECFAPSHAIIFIMENCINFFETFLSPFNCRQLCINIENITRDFSFSSDDGFPWLSIIFICTTIFLLYFYRTFYPFVEISSETLQCTNNNTNRNDVQNDYE